MSTDAQLRTDRGEQIIADEAVLKLPISRVGPVIFLFELVAVVTISVISGVVYHRIVLGRSGDIEAFVAIGLTAFLYYALIFVQRGNYSIANLASGWQQVREVTAVWAIVFLFLLAIAFLLKIGPLLSRGATSTFFVLGWLFLAGWRWRLASYLAGATERGVLAEGAAVVVGDAELLARPAILRELKRCGYRTAKILPIGDKPTIVIVDETIKATRDDHQVNAVFLAMDWTQVDRIDDLVHHLGVVPMPILLLADPSVSRFLDKPIVQLGTLWASELQRSPLTFQERATKRLFDIVLAGSAAVLLLPLMVIVALLIVCDSPGTIFFVQTRGGFNGRPFGIFKFRTLRPQKKGSKIRQVSRHDHRFTRIGRVLRRTSIDELPQLLNVIRGEMSLVGPRPHAAEHNAHYQQVIGSYAFRHHVKPGLTGWAQVNGLRGRADVESMKRRVDYDLWYINNWNLWLDIKIIAKTLWVIFRQPTAY